MPATSIYLPTSTSAYLPKNIEYYPVDTVDHYLWVVIVAFFAAFMAAFGIGYASDARRPSAKHTRAREMRTAICGRPSFAHALAHLCPRPTRLAPLIPSIAHALLSQL